ncbi:MAG: hypothetical protein HC802_17660 [Caldilineaceae bacterium]|nr:hypothetical protein [Caldilineaceae bacterium]
MSSSYYPYISDELLSAYIDDAVSDEEKLSVESAVATDSEVAWRLQTLRHTVGLVRDLPLLPLPRSFTISAEQLAPLVVAEAVPSLSAAVPDRPARTRRTGQLAAPIAVLQTQWLRFWLNGNAFLRNAATASLILFVVLLLGDARSGAAMSLESAATTSFSQTENPAQSPESSAATALVADAASLDQAGVVANAVFVLPTVTPTPQPVYAKIGVAESKQAGAEALAPGTLAEAAGSTNVLADAMESGVDFASEPVPVTRLQLSQLAAGLLTFILLVLWWYSRPVRIQPRRPSPLHR